MKPEEAKQKTYDAVIQAGEDQLAMLLKPHYNHIRVLRPQLAEIPQEETEEFRRMAKEALDTGHFTAPGRYGDPVKVSIAELIDDAKRLNIDFTPPGGGNVIDGIPTRKSLERMAEAVSNGVAEETGSIGFLGGATVMNAIKGFFAWLKNGFSGGFDGLKDSIAQVTADSMRKRVEGNLQAVSAEPGMGFLRHPGVIDKISSHVQYTALKEAGVKSNMTPPPESQATLENTRIQTIDDLELDNIEKKIYRSVTEPDGQPSLKDQIAENYWQGIQEQSWIKRQFAPDREQVDASAGKMAHVIGNTISKSVMTPALSGPYGSHLLACNKERYATAIADNVGNALLAHEKEFDLAFKLSDITEVDGKPMTHLQRIKQQVETSILTGDHYDQLHLASQAANQHAMRVASEQSKIELDKQVSYSATQQPLIPGEQGVPTRLPAGPRGAEPGIS